jgi:hypothetical protein
VPDENDAARAAGGNETALVSIFRHLSPNRR